MEKSMNYIKICRYLGLLGPIVGTMVTRPAFINPYYILIALLLFINAQIRMIFLREKPFIVSLIMEMVLILYLYFQVGGYLILILFSSLVDALLDLNEEGILFFVLIGGGLLYSLYQSASLQWVFVIGLFYLAFSLLLLHLKQELHFRRDTETLYDQIRKSHYDLEEARVRLYNYSKQVEKLSQLEERQRISRELHDTLGHNLAGILMQVDAARQIMPLDQKKGLNILESAYENINRSIEEVGNTVGRIHPAVKENYMESIQRLIEKCRQDTGLNIRYETFGTPYPLYPSIEMTLYKNIREALTNALRHGKARNVYIQLTYQEAAIDVVIQDDGKGAEHIKKGFGLLGMEERLEMVGGSISYSGDQGFGIKMQIPRREF